MLMEIYRSGGDNTYYFGPVVVDGVEKYVIATRSYDEKGRDKWDIKLLDYGEFANRLEHSRRFQDFVDCH